MGAGKQRKRVLKQLLLKANAIRAGGEIGEVLAGVGN